MKRRSLVGLVCYICGQPAESWDHVIPKHKGGSSEPENLEPCCIRCNHIKGSFTLPFSFPTKQAEPNLVKHWLACHYPSKVT